MLFLVSFLLVFTSSYFTSSILTKNCYEHFAYMLLTAFAQVILSFEILSLFSAISILNVLIFNVLIFILSLVVWLKKQRPICFPDFKHFFKTYLNVCKLDRSLIILTISFLIFIIGAFWLVLVMPITNADAVDYHVARSMIYILNGSLNHFDSADVRMLTFPFNSEIVYAWILLLLKKEAFLGGLSFFSYLLSIFSIAKFMKLAGFCLRKIIWSVFLLSSFSSVIVQISGTEIDVLTASLILTSITLFWISFKNNKIVNLIFSALAYAIAVGTKTTAIIAIPAVAVIMLFLSYKYKNFKNFTMFCCYFVLNFLIFSAYLYAINFIDYGNIMGTKASIVAHKNFFGIRGMIANFVRHLFLFVDFSGFKWGDYIGQYFLAGKLFILKFLHVSDVPEGLYSYPKGAFQINGTLLEPDMSFGILGFLVFLPCIIYSFIKSLWSKNFRVLLLSVLSFSFILFVLVLSYIIVYMNFNCRFLAMFAVIIAPVLSYSYYRKNNPLKVIFIVFMIYYLVLVSSHLWARPWWTYAKKMIYNNYTISDVRLQAKFSNSNAEKSKIFDPFSRFWLSIFNSKEFANKKILYFPSNANNIFLPKSFDYFYNSKIDIGVVYNIEKYNLEDYDYLIFFDKRQFSTVFDEKNIIIDYEYVNKDMTFYTQGPYHCFYYIRTGILTAEDDFSKLNKFPFAIECFPDMQYLVTKNFIYLTSYEVFYKDSTDSLIFYIYKNEKK